MNIEEKRKKIEEKVKSLNEKNDKILNKVLTDLLGSTDKETVKETIELYGGDIEKAIEALALQQGKKIDKSAYSSKAIEGLQQKIKGLIIESLKEQYKVLTENEEQIKELDADKENIEKLDQELDEEQIGLQTELNELEGEKTSEIQRIDDETEKSRAYCQKYEKRNKNVISVFENEERLGVLQAELQGCEDIEALLSENASIKEKLDKIVDEKGEIVNLTLDILDDDVKERFETTLKALWSDLYGKNRQLFDELGIDFVEYDDFSEDINKIPEYIAAITTSVEAQEATLQEVKDPTEEDKQKSQNLSSLSKNCNSLSKGFGEFQKLLKEQISTKLNEKSQKLTDNYIKISDMLNNRKEKGRNFEEKIANFQQEVESLRDEQSTRQGNENFNARMIKGMYRGSYAKYLENKDNIKDREDIIEEVESRWDGPEEDAEGNPLPSKNQKIKSLEEKIDKLDKARAGFSERTEKITKAKEAQDLQKKQLLDDIEKYNGYEDLGIEVGASDILPDKSKQNTKKGNEKDSKDSQTEPPAAKTTKEPKTKQERGSAPTGDINEPANNQNSESERENDSNDDYLPILSKKDAKVKAKEVYYKLKGLSAEGQKKYLNGDGFNEAINTIPHLSKRQKNKLKIFVMANVDSLNPGDIKDIGQVLKNVNQSFQDPPIDGFKIDDLFDLKKGKLKPFKDQDAPIINTVNTLLQDVKTHKEKIPPEQLKFIESYLIPSLKEGLITNELNTMKPSIFERVPAKRRELSLNRLLGTINSYNRPVQEQEQNQISDNNSKKYTVVSSDEPKTQSIIEALQASVETDPAKYSKTADPKMTAPDKSAR